MCVQLGSFERGRIVGFEKLKSYFGIYITLWCFNVGNFPAPIDQMLYVVQKLTKTDANRGTIVIRQIKCASGVSTWTVGNDLLDERLRGRIFLTGVSPTQQRYRARLLWH